MNRIAVVSCLLFGALLGPARAQESLLAPVAWLTGCWAEEGAEAGTIEQWMAPAGGTMLGMGRTVKNGKTATFEFMRLRANEEGKLVFIALPRGQGETTFTLISHIDQRAVFENLGHDFPQRVIYQKLANDKLAARIEG
ncbi:MAG: hypothetical protein H7Y28_03820, partial [Rhodoferax sp.]|nr:hypothetical protein [Rhodoferax sp.]